MNPRTVLRALRTPVTMLVLIIFVAFAAQWGYRAATAPIPEPAPKPCVVTDVGDQLTTSQVYVRVFNGTETSGLGKRMAAVLRADGFNVFKTTNTAEPTWKESVVVGSSEDSPEVVLVRQAFKDIPFRADQRVDGTVDVIIGAKAPETVENPEFSAPLEDGKACIPQITVVDSTE